MITNDGKLHIKRYMAGFVPSIAQSIAFGIGSKAKSTSDTKLQFEVGRADITVTSFDFVNNKIIYKASMPEDIDAVVYEAAIFSTPTNSSSGEYGSRLISTFDSDTEDWVDNVTGAEATYTTAVARIGKDSLRHSPAANSSKSDILNQLSLDLSGFSGSDVFSFAFNVGNVNTSSVRFRFMTDNSNHYEFSVTSPVGGYQIVEIAKSAATATGAPNWANITAIMVTTTSKSSGPSVIDLDGIRIEDVDTVNADYVMVSRELFPLPYTKNEGQPQDLEFYVSVFV